MRLGTLHFARGHRQKPRVHTRSLTLNNNNQQQPRVTNNDRSRAKIHHKPRDIITENNQKRQPVDVRENTYFANLTSDYSRQSVSHQ